MKTALISVLLFSAGIAGAQELTDITPAMARETAVNLPVSRPVPGEDKKLKVCWIKAVENDACVYKCSDGATLRNPMEHPFPGQDGSYSSCPQLIFPIGNKPEAAPKAGFAEELAAPETDKKLTVCWIKGLKENTCVYKCNNGEKLEQPMQQPIPGSQTPVIPCPQLVFPHKTEAMKAATPVQAEIKAEEKKVKACWIKKIKDGVCSYKCSGGSLLEEPMFSYPTGDMVPLLPCPPVIFQFGK